MIVHISSTLPKAVGSKSMVRESQPIIAYEQINEKESVRKESQNIGHMPINQLESLDDHFDSNVMSRVENKSGDSQLVESVTNVQVKQKKSALIAKSVKKQFRPSFADQLKALTEKTETLLA